MPNKRLTEENVPRIRPPESGQVDYLDTVLTGLSLRVGYGGRKTWRVRHYVKGVDKKTGKKRTEPRMHALGQFPVMSVKQAREAARKFLADPGKALARAEAGTFKDVADAFIKRHVEAKGLRSRPEIERCLAKYVLPRWQHRPFHEIKRRDVANLLDEIESLHGQRQADYVLAIIRKLMNWYATRSDDYVVPIVQGMHRTVDGDRSRKRILGDDEIRALWKACNDAGTFGALVKVLLLTAQRREKVATMTWDDIVDGEWRIPAEAREKSNAGTLRLPQAVLDIVAAQPRIEGNPYVFAARGTGPFNSFSQRKKELALPDMPDWTLHDLRRTARSLMARAGVQDNVAERVLGHAIPGVKGVYDRHTYGPEKADALAKLAALVNTILNPPEGNVVRLRR